jgi:predicted SAM-dependent methyltransferase
LETVSLEGKFDAITAWDVLEHVPHPRAFLSACRSLLRPGGFLFLNVPDLDSWEGELLGRRWPLLLPEHLNYFNNSAAYADSSSLSGSVRGMGL